MARLADAAKVLRSKNSGPFQVTFDIMFDDGATYRAVRDSGVLSPGLIARLYGVQETEVKIVSYDAANAIKVTIPRRCSSGSAQDTDVYGAQYHVLLDIELPA
ncbi:MAG: DUF4387 domain-containing protein [Firmicutes bacterium]|nr:DUF4387 domain-containing protein [Bacillota bacterium]